MPHRYIARAALWLAPAIATIHLLALPASAAGREHKVKVHSDLDTYEMYFEPRVLHIASGDTVVWENQVLMDHNILSYPGGYPEGAEPFQSPFLSEPGQTWSHIFTVPGTYEYHCLPHVTFGMRGVIVVDRPSEDSEFHRPTKQQVEAYRQQLLEYFDESEITVEVRPRHDLEIDESLPD